MKIELRDVTIMGLPLLHSTHIVAVAYLLDSNSLQPLCLVVGQRPFVLLYNGT